MSKYKVEVEYRVKKYIWIEADNSSKAVQMVEDNTELYDPSLHVMGLDIEDYQDISNKMVVISVTHLEGDITNNT